MRIEKTVDVDIYLSDILDQMEDSDLEVVIDNLEAETLMEALRQKNLSDEQIKEFVKLAKINCIDIVRNKFESSHNGALEVLQDLLGMQHTTTKEQVIEQLKQIL